MIPNLNSPGIKTFTAGVSVTKGQIVKFSGGKVIPAAAATDLPVGVALDGANKDDQVPVAVLGNAPGTLRIAAGGVIAQGAQVTALGTATSAGTDVIVGIALEAAAAEGDEIEIAHQVAHVK